MSIDYARQNKKRVFYSEYTNTIRSYPENYLLCVKDDFTGKWSAHGDAACKSYRHKIQNVIDTVSDDISPMELSDWISRVVPTNSGYAAWQPKSLTKKNSNQDA